ncbi:hypothetical protein IFM89_026789, partial [Coptis chinensis]
YRKTNQLKQSGKYQKNIWHPDLLESLQTDYKEKACARRVEKLKEEVKDMLIDGTVGSLTKLELIDDLNRLGVGYHFEKDINKILDTLSINKDACPKDDLHSTALLWFFSSENSEHIGFTLMLTFLPLTLFHVNGEKILYEAKEFTAKHLKLLNGNIDRSLAEEVTHSLELPLHWRMPRWWKHLGLSNKLSFARDRLVEGFLWSVGLAYGPQYLCCREWITKVVCFILTLDDLYDNYGSLEELKLFTAAVERWDLAALAQLPDCMITCFLALFNTTNDIVYTKYKARGFNILPQLKKAWAEFCKAMLVEAEWSYMRYTPSLSEYLENAWVSSSTTVGLVHAFFGTEQLITNDILECLDRNSDLIYYSSMVFRLCNDLATSSAELESGDELSAIQCYMHEANTSEHVARDKIKGLISDVWKKLNKSIYDSPFKSSFVNIAINHARAAHTFYQNGDGVSVQDHEAKKRVTGLLIEPITIQNKESSESLELNSN